MDPLGAKKWRGAITDHFDGEVFYNLEPGVKTLQDALLWLRTRTPSRWPSRVELSSQPPPPLTYPSTKGAHVTLIGHATLLIQTSGLNFLTDPVWSERCSPIAFAGPKRVIDPGIPLDQLPHIDVILLSHNHYDHMDIATLRYLHKRHRPVILTGLGNARYLKDRRIGNVIEMDWWESTNIGNGLAVTFSPARHFSSRSYSDRNRTLWGGFVIATGETTLFFAGDTAYGKHFRMIRDRFGPIDLALLPIGAYEPRWFMASAHMNPDDSVMAFRDLDAHVAVAMHFGTFQLTDEPYDAPIKELGVALAKYDVSWDRFVVLEAGQGKNLCG